MEWNDDAIVLSSRAHGESGAILELLTRDHGRHAGLVRGGASRRVKPTLQPGNSVHVQWRARLEEHLGTFTCELARARAGELMDSRDALAGLNAFTAVTSAAMPEREAHAAVFRGGELLLDAMLADDTAHWLPLYVRWEAGLLEALGFGLDLRESKPPQPAVQPCPLGVDLVHDQFAHSGQQLERAPQLATPETDDQTIDCSADAGRYEVEPAGQLTRFLRDVQRTIEVEQIKTRRRRH